MKPLIMLLNIFFIAISVVGQYESSIVIEPKVISESKLGLEGAKVEVFKKDILIKTILSNSKGKFDEISLDYHNQYFIVFSKKKYVPKTLEVDTRIPLSIGEVEEISVFPCDVKMIKSKWWKKNKIISEIPVARIHSNPENRYLDYDRPFIKQRSKEIEKY